MAHQSRSQRLAGESRCSWPSRPRRNLWAVCSGIRHGKWGKSEFHQQKNVGNEDLTNKHMEFRVFVLFFFATKVVNNLGLVNSVVYGRYIKLVKGGL